MKSTPDPQPPTDDAMDTALRRSLMPLVRLTLGSGLTFQTASDMLKDLFVEAAERDHGLQAKRLTDSRLSVLTGLQRKDVKAVRARLADRHPSAPATAGPVPRVLSRWRNDPRFQTDAGLPRPLPRTAEDGIGFDALVAEISRDVHPRTILDELLRTGAATLTDGMIHLERTAHLPAAQPDRLGYLGANLGDHGHAAVENVLGPTPAPHFDRAVHYNHLTAEALAELSTLARDLLSDALTQIDARAAALQKASLDAPGQKGRMRAGAYMLMRDDQTKD